MTSTQDLILEIKKAKEEQGLSYADIKLRMEQNGDAPLSDATLSRIFAEGSENNRSFSYDYTLVPLARSILDIETVEVDDENNVKVLKELLKLKHSKIRELEQALDKEKASRHEKIDKEREQFRRSLDFLREQMDLKDKRMDTLLERVGKCLNMIEIKDQRIESLTSELLAMKDLKEAYQHCPYKRDNE